MIKIIENEDLIYHVNEYDVILVGTSTMNALGNGFQKKVALNFPFVAKANKKTKFGDPRKLGTINCISGEPTFLLCYINKGRFRPDLNPDYLDYDALDACLAIVDKHFKGKSVATTFIGTSKYDGDGNRTRVNDILNKYPNIDLTIYDYEQKDYDQELRDKWKEVVEQVGTDNYIEYKKRFFWVRAFGELTPVPEGWEDMSDKDVKTYIKQKKAEH